MAAGHLNPPTPRPRGSAWGWACYPGDRKLSVREVQYRGVETVSTTGGWGAQRVPMGLSGGALGRLAPVGRRKWKSKVFLKGNLGFCRSRVLPSGSREGGLGVPGMTSGRRRAPSVCSEDDFGSSGDDLGATLKQKFNFWENFGHENRFRWKIYESGNTKYEIRNTKYETRNTKYDIRCTKYNTKYEIQRRSIFPVELC